MKQKYSAILWREFNKDIKSLKSLFSYLVICIFTMLYYKKSGNIADSYYFTAIGILVISLYNSIYYLNNIATVLCLPIQMRDYCMGRTIYKMLRLCAWMLCYHVAMIITYDITIALSLYFISRILLTLITLSCSVYFLEYFILMIGRRYLSIVTFAITYIFVLIKFLINSTNVVVNMLLIMLDLVMIIYGYIKSESMELESIVRRWI